MKSKQVDAVVPFQQLIWRTFLDSARYVWVDSFHTCTTGCLVHRSFVLSTPNSCSFISCCLYTNSKVLTFCCQPCVPLQWSLNKYVLVTPLPKSALHSMLTLSCRLNSIVCLPSHCYGQLQGEDTKVVPALPAVYASGPAFMVKCQHVCIVCQHAS